MQSTAFLTAKPQAELVIRWSDKSETRHVRPAVESDATKRPSAVSPETEEEDYRVVMECAPYTASFNHLLSERRANENARKFTALVYERMRADAVPLNTETYNLLMSRLVRFTDGSIFDLYEELKTEGLRESSSVQPNKETFTLLFRACERSAEYQRAFLLYQEMREQFHLTPDTTTYNTLLGFCAAVKDVAQACYYVDEMKTNAVPMDTNTYNCYMSVLVDSAPYSETLDVFNRMCDNGAQPTRRTYNTLLKAMRAHGDFDKGFQVYEEMKKKGCIPDIVTYNILLWLCEDRLDYVLGTGAYGHMLRSQDQIATGTAAIANLALTLLAEMQAVGLQPNTFSYNKVLAVLLRCEDPRIFTVYSQVQEACAATARTAALRAPFRQPSPRQQGSSSLPRRESVSSQQSLKSPLGSLTPSASGGTLDRSNTTPTNSHTAIRRSGAGRAGNTTGSLTPRTTRAATLEDASLSLEEAMREEDPTEEGCICGVGVRANIETEKRILRAFLLFNQPGQCKQLHLANRELYDSFHMTRDLALLLFEVCERTADRVWADTLLQEVLAEKLYVDVELFNAYLSVLSTVADPALAEHFHMMKLGIHKLGVRANTQTFNIVLRGHFQQRQLAEGLAVFAVMCDPYGSRVGEIVPNDETYSLVIQLYDELHDGDAVTEVVERALCKGQRLGLTVFHQLLRLFLHSKDPRTETWFTRLQNAGGDEGLPTADAECYAIVMEYYLAEGRYENVTKLFRELKTSRTLEPNPSVYRVIFNMYKTQRDRKAMTAVFDDARMNSIKLDVSMYNSVLEVFVEAGDPFVFEVLTDMRENCIPPEDSTMAIFLASPTGRQQLSEAVSHRLFYKPTGNGYF